MAKYDVGSSETLRIRLALPRHGPSHHQSIEKGFLFFDKLAEVADIGVMSDISYASHISKFSHDSLVTSSTSSQALTTV
jgi:hypothetical protein